MDFQSLFSRDSIWQQIEFYFMPRKLVKCKSKIICKHFEHFENDFSFISFHFYKVRPSLRFS